MSKFLWTASIALLSGIAMTTQLQAATATGNMNVRITITAECRVATATDLDFGTSGVIAANVDQTSTIGIQCTNTTPYTISLGVGNGAGATVAVRRMTGPGAATVDYSIYRDIARTQVWGQTIGTDTIGGTGNGAIQNITAYGRVPAQTTPAAGAYTDIVQITVTY